MASHHHTPLSNDAPVAVKININGTEEHRKCKLTLKDLGPSVLPEKLRHLLSVPPSKDAVFERYSDSSASYIVLDSNNQSVYKQLHRAAKAKGKLRLMVTITDKVGQEPERSETPTAVSERLPSRSYVHPYVSENLADQSPSSRISMLEDFKTLSAAPSTITLTPFTISQAEPKKEALPPPPPPPYFWPIQDNKGFSEATKAKFEKKEAENVKEHKMEKDGGAEAPVPRLFSARGQCLAHLANAQQKHVAERKTSRCPVSANFILSCNQCDGPIPDHHWHCGICDKGDFDLCIPCVQKGFVCDNEKHWLIKRFFKDGKITNSTTETIAPKSYAKGIPGAFASEVKTEFEQPERTCNACVQVYPESNFVNCSVCDDYDLCMPCHLANRHGHHPAHTFESAVKGAELSTPAANLLKPGRNVRHCAICDGCDKTIYGIRHKCLNCPDWDYCSQCHSNAHKTHPGHRFAAFHEPLPNQYVTSQVHSGICCDGPLCEGKGGFITGDRYKCAVCSDLDFCAKCEALPTLKHNRTHPLLKFKTPVRNVSVSTYGEKANGESMRPMGDQPPQVSSKSTETTPPASSTNAATQVQPSVEVKRAEPKMVEAKPKEDSKLGARHPFWAPHLQARFVRDVVADGTFMTPNTQFTQTWTLRNTGPLPWPAGCSVSFVGGDSMLDVDANHPSSIEQLNKALSTNTITRPVEKDEEIDFTVSMRTPEREGKAISYWRLKAADGTPFGHRLWCDVNVRKSIKQEESTEEKKEAENPVAVKSEPEVKEEEEQPKSSQMIFPTLAKESPISSKHEDETSPAPVAAAATLSPAEQDLLEDVESLELDDNDASSDEGFLTDEEYELIASGDEMEVAKNGKK